MKMYQRDKSTDKKTVKIRGVYSSPEKAFEFCWSSFADEHTVHLAKIDQETRKIE